MIYYKDMKIFVRLKTDFWFRQKDIENITYIWPDLVVYLTMKGFCGQPLVLGPTVDGKNTVLCIYLLELTSR